MDSEYKQIREDFIRGLNGSSVSEVLALCSIGQLSNFLLISILSFFSFAATNSLLSWRILFEMCIIWFPFIISVTLLSEYVYYIILTLISLIIIFISLSFVKRKSKRIRIEELLELKLVYQTRHPFVTNLLASLLLSVSIAILAVDFKAFPRRFAKTETFGWSLMDVGVGGFIAINGGLSPESRLGSEGSYTPLFLLRKSVLSSIPMILIGFQRLAAVKSLNYHEHITEYGLHWNFFFTLAFTKLFSTMFCCLFASKVRVGIVGMMILVVHQILLTYGGLSEFVQNDNRVGLFAANKEGMISLFGYLSLHLLFVEFGKHLLKKRENLKEYLVLGLQMWLTAACFAVLMMLSHYYIENISRRVANLAFICWMVTFVTILIGVELFMQAISQILRHLRVFPDNNDNKSILFSSIGFAGLIMFLIANVLTGVVNFSIDTLNASPNSTLIILAIYSVILSFCSLFCDFYKIQLKIPLTFKRKSN